MNIEHHKFIVAHFKLSCAETSYVPVMEKCSSGDLFETYATLENGIQYSLVWGQMYNDIPRILFFNFHGDDCRFRAAEVIKFAKETEIFFA